jgi:branched-chain amino acid transport system substrate-binding protein
LNSRKRDLLGILALLVAAFALLAAGCGGDDDDDDAGGAATTEETTDDGGGGGETLKIVSDLPLQGSDREQTAQMNNAIRLVLEDADNKAGDFTIEFEAFDDSTAAKGAWDEAVCASNARMYAEDDSIVGVIGTYNSGCAAIEIPIVNEAGLAMISPANTAVGLTHTGPGSEQGEPEKYYPDGCTKNYHRVVPADDLQGLAGAKWAVQLGFEKVYVIDDSQLYGKGLADVFRAEAPGQGLEIVGNDGILGTETDYKALAEKVAQADPDLVYFGGITQQNAGQLWRDIKDALPDVEMMGPDGIAESAFLEAAGDAAEGTYTTFGGLPADELTGKGGEFVSTYRDRFGDLEPYTAYGYEAGNVMFDAIERAGARNPSDNTQLRAFVLDEVKKTADYEGVLGTWSFDANGDTTLTGMSGSQVQNGEFTFVTVIE